VKKWVANGVWPTLPGTWAVHALCLLTALALLMIPRLADGAPLRWSGGSGMFPRRSPGMQ
jgi:hypothetical protein